MGSPASIVPESPARSFGDSVLPERQTTCGGRRNRFFSGLLPREGGRIIERNIVFEGEIPKNKQKLQL